MFLKAMALGLTVPAALRVAKLATAAGGTAPKRFFLMYIPHGTAPEHYAPKVNNATVDPTMPATYTDFDLDKTNVSILGPLQAYKSYVNVYQGIQYVGAAATHTGIVNCLSGIEQADTTTPRTSVDQVIGKALNIKPLILGACSHQPFGLDSNGMLFWNGTPIDPQKSPVKAADALFAGITSGAPAPVSVDVQLRKDLLGFTGSEIQSLQKTLTGLTREQTKLATHLSAIQALQSDSSMTSHSSCTTKPSLPTVEMVRAASAGNVVDPSGGNDYFYQAANFPLLFQAQLEVVARGADLQRRPHHRSHADVRDLRFRFRIRGRAGRAPQRPLAHGAAGGRGRPVQLAHHDRQPTGDGAHPIRHRAEVVHDPAREQGGERARHHRRPGGAGHEGSRQHPHLCDERDWRRAGPQSGERDSLPAGPRQPAAHHHRQVRRRDQERAGGPVPDRPERHGRYGESPRHRSLSNDGAGHGSCHRELPWTAQGHQRGARVSPASMTFRTLLGALSLSMSLAGCAGSVMGSGTAGGTGSQGAAGSAGATAGTTGAGGSSAPGNPNFTLTCSAPTPGSPMLRLLTRTELVNTLNDVFPDVKGQWSSSLPSNSISAHGFDNDGSAQVGNQLASAILDTATSLATALVGSPLANILPCSTGAGDHACAQTFLAKYGQRLFRRPLTNDEQQSYLAFFDASKAKSDFKTALKWMTIGLVQSPNALYRSEIGTANGGGRQLGPYEIATELAYTYTGSTPSDALLQMAGGGNLGDPVALARSLATTAAGKQMLQRFFEQYLDYASVVSMQKPNVPMFSQVAPDMVQETHAFIDSVVFQGGGGLKELLTSSTTNPSRALAAYYGTGNAYSGGFPMPAQDYASVQRPAGLGIGVLAQGAFLATHASSDTSSPTKRGLFPYYRLFCAAKLTPPPNVPPLDTTSAKPNVNTTRDRYELLHQMAGANCSVCHKQFDPIGFGSEHFDEGGRYRAKEKTFDINASGSVPTPDGSTLKFSSQEDLMMALSEEPVIHQCFAAFLAAYGFGSDEPCIGSSQVPDLQAGKIGIQEAFVRLAGEPHFTQRASQ